MFQLIFILSEYWTSIEYFFQRNLTLFSGPINISTSAVLVSPGVAVHGTMSITSSEVYFEVDEDHADFKKLDAQVGTKF